MKETNGPRGLVPLQMADQMPGRRQTFHNGRLGLPFLDAVFAEMPDAQVKADVEGISDLERLHDLELRIQDAASWQDLLKQAPQQASNGQ